MTSASPFIVGVGGRMGQSPARHVAQPMQTITSKADSCVAQPTLAPYLTEHANASNQRTMAADEPLRTICAQVKGGHFSVVAPVLAPLRGTSEQHLGGHTLEAPLSTVSAGGTHHALVGANLVTIGYGEREGQAARAQDLGLPLGTVVAGGVKSALVAALLTKFNTGSVGSSLTVTAGGTPKRPSTGIQMGLVAAYLEQANGGFYEGDGRAADEPMSTITASGSNQRLVTAYLVKYYVAAAGQDSACAEPMHTVSTKARMGLVQVQQVPAALLSDEHAERARLCAELLHQYLPEHFPDPAELVLMWHAGQWWVVADITLRMLKPRELYRAQGFPEGYLITEIPDPALLFIDGQQSGHPLALPRIPLTAEAQVRMCGNSVSPPAAEALVPANFAHEAQIYGLTAA